MNARYLTMLAVAALLVSATALPQRARTKPPGKPTVELLDVGQTHLSLGWRSETDGGFVFYEVYRDGQYVMGAGVDYSPFSGLRPGTTYTFRVRARGASFVWSPWSDPITVTTRGKDAVDASAPSPVQNVREDQPRQGEWLWLTWDTSRDDWTPQDWIIYEVYNNGVFVGNTANFYMPFFAILEPGTVNRIEVFARDRAGNFSKPTLVVYDLR